MIIEVFMKHSHTDCPDPFEYTQTYVINDDDTFTVQNIRSHKDAAEVIELLMYTLFLFDVCNPKSDAPKIDLEEMSKNNWFEDGAKVCITVNSDRVEIVFHSDLTADLTLPNGKTIIINVNGEVPFEYGIKMDLYPILLKSGCANLINKLLSLVIYDDTAGAMIASRLIINEISEITGEFNEMAEKEGTDPEEGISNLMKAIMSSHPCIVFGDYYGDLEAQRKDGYAEEGEDMCELEWFKINMEAAREEISLKRDQLPHQVICVNADPCTDPYLESYDEHDAFHQTMKELMQDPDAQKFIKDCLHDMIDNIFSGKEPLSEYHNENGPSIHIVEGYVDEDGHLHIIDKDKDGNSTDRTLDQ